MKKYLISILFFLHLFYFCSFYSYAYSEEEADSALKTLPSTNYNNYIVFYCDNKFHSIFTNNDLVMLSDQNGFIFGSRSGLEFKPSDSSYVVYMFSNNSWSDGNIVNNTPYFTNYIYCVESNIDVYRVKDYSSSTQSYNLYPDPIYLKPSTNDKYTYSTDLGYLAGIDSRTRLFEITDDVADTFVINRIFRFGWDNKTTTGIDLWRNSFRKMQIQPRIHVFGHIRDKNGNALYPLEGYIDKDIFDVTQINFQYSTDDMESDFPYFFSDDRIPFRGSVDLEFEVFFRILAQTNDGDYLRGGWVRARPSYTSNSWGLADSSSVTVDAGDINDGGYTIDSNSSYGGGVVSNISHGSGSTITEASNSSNPFSQPDSPNDIISYIEMTVAMVEAMPRIIAAIFSFLPPWCLGFIGLQFSICALIMTIKFIRG